MARTTVLSPVGARVEGLDLRNVGAADVDAIEALLAQHGVVVFPGQDLGDDDFVAFLQGFGDLMFTTGETPVAGCPDLNVVSNVGRSTPPRSVFHSDSSYLRRPPTYTALRAVTIPAEGGETLFSNQYAAFETLPVALRERLSGRTITHVVTGLALEEDEESSAQHDVFIEHPGSGRTTVYLSSPARCAAISGLAEDEARELVALLFEHCTRAENVYRHVWSPGDVVMWDNRCVLHRADHAGVVGDRVMHRGMVGS